VQKNEKAGDFIGSMYVELTVDHNYIIFHHPIIAFVTPNTFNIFFNN